MGDTYAFPGNDQGFGRVQLRNVLLLSTSSPSFDLYVDEISLSYNFKLEVSVFNE